MGFWAGIGRNKGKAFRAMPTVGEGWQTAERKRDLKVHRGGSHQIEGKRKDEIQRVREKDYGEKGE